MQEKIDRYVEIVAEKLGHDTDFNKMMAILNDYLAVGNTGYGYKIKRDGAYLHFDCPSEDFQTKLLYKNVN